MKKALLAVGIVGILLAVGLYVERNSISKTPTNTAFEITHSEASPVITETQDIPFRDETYQNAYANWWMAVEGKFFGANMCNIAIETNGESPGDAEFALLDKVFEKEQEINKEIETAFFKKYQVIRGQELKKMSRELDPETAKAILPKINSPSDIWRVGGYSVVEMPIQEDEKLRFRILLLCNWDDEYGLQARYIDGKFMGLEKGQH